MTRPRPLFGSDATSPLFADLTDPVGTLPMFPDLEPAADARPAPTLPVPSVDPAPMRHAPEPCDWPMPCDVAGCPDHGHDYCPDHDPRCGRPAVAVYVLVDHEYPRCARHDTKAARRRAEADGWDRRPVSQEDPA